jgi:hypothetical protein
MGDGYLQPRKEFGVRVRTEYCILLIERGGVEKVESDGSWVASEVTIEKVEEDRGDECEFRSRARQDGKDS